MEAYRGTLQNRWQCYRREKGLFEKAFCKLLLVFGSGKDWKDLGGLVKGWSLWRSLENEKGLARTCENLREVGTGSQRSGPDRAQTHSSYKFNVSVHIV